MKEDVAKTIDVNEVVVEVRRNCEERVAMPTSSSIGNDCVMIDQPVDCNSGYGNLLSDLPLVYWGDPHQKRDWH